MSGDDVGCLQTLSNAHRNIYTFQQETTHTEKSFAVPTSKPRVKKVKSNEEHTCIKSTKSYDLEPAKDFIQNHLPTFVLSFDQLNLLLSNVIGVQDPFNIIQEFTSDLLGLVHMLTKVHPQLKDRSTKRYITFLKKKILRHLGNDISESEGESSQVTLMTIMTLVKKSLVANVFPVNSNIETIVIEITAPVPIFICNIYLSSSSSATNEDLKSLIEQIPSHRIIVGDFNGHNFIWGSKRTDYRGKLLEKVMQDLQLNFLNDGSPTRFNICTGESFVIDLSFCDPGLAPRLSWNVLEYTYGTFNSVILQSAELFIGKTKPIKNHVPVPWWNSECNEAENSDSETSLSDEQLNLESDSGDDIPAIVPIFNKSYLKEGDHVIVIYEDQHYPRKIKEVEENKAFVSVMNIHKDSILKSTSNCLMSIDRNIYKEISCQESYLLQPFSNYDQGAITTVTQNLVLIHENSVPAVDENEITRRVSLTFENIISTKPTTNHIEQSTQALKLLCELDAMADRMELANLFSKFIYSLRLLSHSGLEELQNEAGNICSKGKQYLFHALPFVNTIDSVTLMKNIITEKLASETTINEFITSIGFMPNPDSEMMDIAQSLLQESETFSANKALSISNLAHTYCSNTKECSSDYSIYSINEYFQNHFGELIKNSPFNRETHDEIMVTLKALSNIGTMSEDFYQELFKVIENSEIDVAIRVAAVETFRRTRCEETRSYFEHIFRRQEVDSEVRIASYLQIMRCPNYLMVKTIKHALMNEEVNQVGSFVWTHLNNLMTSAKPSKVEVQSFLSDKDLAKKFDSDIRKFSRNFEGSMYFEEYSIGGNYESNVIFSTESYVPKSGMLNLTFDLFGESFNVLEIYGRVDGFEHYLETFFWTKRSLTGSKR
ncbi:apolipophorins-like [Diabrotica undecimpunctata]|uniref:apolipophorins-like n=1 Tax=Diabrotica undecimpunctata TaxID=50387 RepID=UPI003B63C416